MTTPTDPTARGEEPTSLPAPGPIRCGKCGRIVSTARGASLCQAGQRHGWCNGYHCPSCGEPHRWEVVGVEPDAAPQLATDLRATAEAAARWEARAHALEAENARLQDEITHLRHVLDRAAWQLQDRAEHGMSKAGMEDLAERLRAALHPTEGDERK